jgi:hypothetical protein
MIQTARVLVAKSNCDKNELKTPRQCGEFLFFVHLLPLPSGPSSFYRHEYGAFSPLAKKISVYKM